MLKQETAPSNQALQAGRFGHPFSFFVVSLPMNWTTKGACSRSLCPGVLLRQVGKIKLWSITFWTEQEELILPSQPLGREGRCYDCNILIGKMVQKHGGSSTAEAPRWSCIYIMMNKCVHIIMSLTIDSRIFRICPYMHVGNWNNQGTDMIGGLVRFQLYQLVYQAVT